MISKCETQETNITLIKKETDEDCVATHHQDQFIHTHARDHCSSTMYNRPSSFMIIHSLTHDQSSSSFIHGQSSSLFMIMSNQSASHHDV